MVKHFLCCLLVLTGLLGQAAANPEEALPTSLPGVSVLTAEEIVRAGNNAIIIDTRPLHDYLAARIPGSLHIPYKEHSPRRLDYDASLDNPQGFLKRLHKFVPHRETPVVFYCNGTACWKSFKSARAALKDGYTQVRWLRGGIVEWQKKNLPTDSQ